ncbi:helix-turn-helix domain-containing protein [Leptolyngbya ohadii]|uniref:helix-turn-helix domain-containing protein n=1 Tax=Leptolyngbya ohadii TaxID=1962290 RepID=UPI0019D4521F|nr:helix-turn-helix transcriptional regulator [Leptolyngbya ohadii]
MSLETLDIAGWEHFTETWNENAAQVLEWVEEAESCLQAVQNSEFSDQLVFDIKLSKARLEAASKLLEEISSAFSAVAKPPSGHAQWERVQKNLERTESRVRLLDSELNNLINSSIINSPKEAELFLNSHIEPIPTGAPFISSLESQLRKDLWYDRDGIAVFSKIAKSNHQNYIEHYISSPGDVTTLPWDAAEKIINNFGFNTVKLQMILAAHAMNQEEPWSGSFTLSGEDVIRNLGWNNRKDISVHQKLSELASCAFALDCLLVKVEWKEGQINRRKTQVTIQTSRMWNIGISATGQKSLLTGKIENLERVELQVQPGLWTKGFLNRGGAKAKEALYQFGYLAQSVLKIDPYHNELALRLALHLTVESRIHTSGEYKVKTLLESLLIGYQTKLEQALKDRYKARDLVDQWNEALKTLIKLGWTVEFDQNYPESLRPDSKTRKPKGYINILLESKLIIRPPEPIPTLLERKKGKKFSDRRNSKPQLSPAKATPLTGEQVKTARKGKGWSQAKLAGMLGVSQQLISHIESGRREPTPEMEADLRSILKL